MVPVLTFPKSTPRKRGRPEAKYRRADSTEIIGISRQADGRWRISATGETFFEPDESLALARFEQVQATLRGQKTVNLPLPPDLGAEDARATSIEAGGRRLRATIKRGQPPEYSIPIGSAAFWAAVRRELLGDPKNVALQTGVDWVARGAELPVPTPSPKLAGLIDVYAAKPGVSQEEITRCRRFWKEFIEIVGIKTLRELTHDHIGQYEAKVADMNLAPKSIKHRYTRIRTVIAHCLKRGKGPEDCRRALDTLAMLEVEAVNSLDPNPITPADFWAVHEAAEKAGDNVFASMMLFSLNAALYSSEAGAVRWDEIDLKRAEFVTRRNKTKVPRVAVLWPETIKAVKALARDRETVFNTPRQHYTRFSAHRDWKKYRNEAKVKATFAQIRDAAFTAACRVSLDQARVLSGHRMPGAVDHYVLRQPQFVADACEGIRAIFKRPNSKPLQR